MRTDVSACGHSPSRPVVGQCLPSHQAQFNGAFCGEGGKIISCFTCWVFAHPIRRMCDSSSLSYIYTDIGKATTMSLELPLVSRNGRLFDPITSTIPRFLEMLAKPHVPPIPMKSFHLSCLDQNVVRVYIQTLCIFPVCFPELCVVLAEVDAIRSFRTRISPKMPYNL